jgi:hypothetical protein
LEETKTKCALIKTADEDAQSSIVLPWRCIRAIIVFKLGHLLL